MRIVSDGSFDPLCPSPLVVANAHTMQPRPNLFREIILGSLDNGQMRCNPCVKAQFRPGDHRCICGCFEFDLPQLFEGIGGIAGDPVYPNSCDMLQAETAPTTVQLTGASQCLNFPHPFLCSWSYTYPIGADPEINGYFRHYQLNSWSVPDNETPGFDYAGLTIDYQEEKHSGFGGALWLINLGYICYSFGASGGVFTLYSDYHTIVGGCTGGTPTWNIPATIFVRGVGCP